MAMTGKMYTRPRSMIDAERVRNPETGSPFDRTRMRPAVVDPPGKEAPPSTRAVTPSLGVRGSPAMAAEGGSPSARPDPRYFVRRHSGFGGAAATIHRTASLSPLRRSMSNLSIPVSPSTLAHTLTHKGGVPLTVGSFTSPAGSTLSATAAAAASRPATAAAGFASPGSRPSSSAKKERRNPANTELRRFYERGDLPCIIDQRGVHNRLAWKVPFDKLDYAHYLPLFFDGLREEEMPYKFIAYQGAQDLLAHGGSRILPVVPQLIIPIKNALNTRRHAVMITALEAMKWLITADIALPGGPMIGRALVPYYRQLLPIMNLFATSNKNLGDATDYGQRKNDVIGDRISEVLNLMEMYGGDDALVNIKYLIPIYQSCMRSA